ncbi:MAG: hypothetical protein KAT77_05805 [Nanoarchaeota archaeon]|nr:hypothetical protein [Nanoarchaeota archaeon]
MDEIKIEPLDKEPEEEPQIGTEKENPEVPPETTEPQIEKVTTEEEVKSTIPKKFIIMVAAIAIIFLAIIAFVPIKNYFFPPTGQVITITDLFQQNLQGELPEEEGYIYNGYSFILYQGLWYTEVQQDNKIFQIPLHFGPKDLEDVEVTGELHPTFQYGDIYITFDPLITSDYISTSIGELTQNLAVIIQRKPVGACTINETDACRDRPIINCTNTKKPVVYFNYDDGPAVELKGNCLVLKGKEYDLLKATDRAILQWYKIMD